MRKIYALDGLPALRRADRRRDRNHLHKFTGKERDGESILDNFQGEVLPLIIVAGRFASPDPNNAGAIPGKPSDSGTPILM